jgi:hypothetical protein
MLRKILSIILVVDRPFTLTEMNVALNLDSRTKSLYDLDLESEDDFKSNIRSWCGLFVSIYHGKLYFLHQTAREFLLRTTSISTTMRTGLQWHRSIKARQAHAVVAELCVRYLDLFNSDADCLNLDRKIHALLDYSSSFWITHFNKACSSNKNTAIITLASKICDPGSRAYSFWVLIFWSYVSQFDSNLCSNGSVKLFL